MDTMSRWPALVRKRAPPRDCAPLISPRSRLLVVGPFGRALYLLHPRPAGDAGRTDAPRPVVVVVLRLQRRKPRALWLPRICVSSAAAKGKAAQPAADEGSRPVTLPITHEVVKISCSFLLSSVRRTWPGTASPFTIMRAGPDTSNGW